MVTLCFVLFFKRCRNSIYILTANLNDMELLWGGEEGVWTQFKQQKELRSSKFPQKQSNGYTF